MSNRRCWGWSVGLMLVALRADAGTVVHHAHPAATTATTIAKPAAPAAIHDGWPDTPPGAVGRGYLAAFAAGDSVMRIFLARELSPESIAHRSIDSRITSIRGLRDRFDRLALASVVTSAADSVVVQLLAADGTQHQFTFQVQSAPPHKLESVTMRDFRTESHGLGGWLQSLHRGFHH